MSRCAAFECWRCPYNILKLNTLKPLAVPTEARKPCSMSRLRESLGEFRLNDLQDVSELLPNRTAANFLVQGRKTIAPDSFVSCRNEAGKSYEQVLEPAALFLIFAC